MVTRDGVGAKARAGIIVCARLAKLPKMLPLPTGARLPLRVHHYKLPDVEADAVHQSIKAATLDDKPKTGTKTSVCNPNI